MTTVKQDTCERLDGQPLRVGPGVSAVTPAGRRVWSRFRWKAEGDVDALDPAGPAFSLSVGPAVEQVGLQFVEAA